MDPCLYSLALSIHYSVYSLIPMPHKHPNPSHSHNNAALLGSASQQQMNAVYSYCHSFAEYYQHFIVTCYRIAPSANLSQLVKIEGRAEFEQVMKEIAQEGYVFMDTISDFTSSYKGEISWVVLAFNNRGYLVDAASLRREVQQLRGIIENPHLIKFTYRQCILLEDVKREWGAFGTNFFDFQLFEKSIGVNKHIKIWPNHTSERPLSAQLQEELQEMFNNMVKYLAQIRYYLQKEASDYSLQKEASDYSLYAYSNHYQLLLKEYRHIAYSFQDEERQYEYLCSQREKRLRQEKENNFDSNSASLHGDHKKEAGIKNERDRQLCQMLMNWREHMARILDCPPRELLTFYQIITIATAKPTSILQIQQILSKDRVQSLQLASKILQVINYEGQLFQDHSNEVQLRNNRRRQQKNMKFLLSELRWDDREEWLNRRNDDSIKLYKQIVSIVQLDGSVVEEFTQGMNRPPLTKGQINRFVKYAEYFRNGNHRKLKEYYESCPQVEGECDREDLQGWQSDDDEMFIVNKHSNSLTSIADSLQKISQKIEEKTVSSIQGPDSCYSLADQLEGNGGGSKIEPLPQNIEQIYLKAVSVKKGYQKVQKRKGGRKQGRQQREEFVPSWEQLKQLLQI